jgi:hypothetical protein
MLARSLITCTTLGKYRLLLPVGHGGMADV